ncbi:alcohol dehydrogenase [Mycobacterium colombiense]|uniref:NAD(P)-dependent alcohol dehydrogenase n=1 Tax=Mycobacterium colombiense TaxID=339268 RepID=UPI0007EFFBE3|nr:NAD(P)-dependent alcohol dehydrogenase [Mycobacterium colombiense]OBK63283.1 alcohol dehydrogenase [Mycobacterium colombiense]
MKTIDAYAATSASEPLTRTTIRRRDVGPHDVAIAVKFSGICHSDIHIARGEFGATQYPLVPGHEIAGVVVATGSNVSRFTVGDRVGVGCIVDSCRECAGCQAGLEQYCFRGATPTYGGVGKDGERTQGGYSGGIVVDENYVLRIPQGLPLDAAAPLLCAGITVYSPLRHWKAGPGKQIAVIGLGGLGHMAVKIGAAMGAEVTVVSQSLKKMEDGLRLGASHYYASADSDSLKKLAGSFDLIVNTVGADLDIDAYLKLLAIDGTMVQVGIPERPAPVPFMSLAAMRRSFAASVIGGIAETQEMLDFCAAHDIQPEIELIEPDYINQAYERVLASDVRYRFVIDTSSLA